MTTPNKCECEGCTCGASEHISRVSGTSRHMNKEIPHFHRTDKDGNTYVETADGKLSTIETNAVERRVEEHRQLEMFDADPTYGDMFPEKFNPDGLPFVVEVTGEQLAAELDRLADTENLPLIIEDLQDGDTVEES